MDEARDASVESIDESQGFCARVGVNINDGIKAVGAQRGYLFDAMAVAFDELHIGRQARKLLAARKDRHIVAAPHKLFNRVRANVASPADDENSHRFQILDFKFWIEGDGLVIQTPKPKI